MNIIITSPSLDTNINVSGISSVTKFIIENNPTYNYIHFILGKRDIEKRGFFTIFRILKGWISWGITMVFRQDILVHFNFALDILSIIRDSPLIIFARLLRKRMVIHLHGGEYLEKGNGPGLIKILLKIVLSGNEPKIVLSSNEKDLIIQKYLAKSVVILPNCIDIQDAKAFNRIYPSKTPIRLLFIGRIVKRKGIEYILRALTIIKEKGIEFKFILAGAGPDQSEFIKKCSLMFESSFEFKGVVSGQEKSELLKKCDIFLLPSLYGEGLPISLLECMLFELVPLVTSDGSMKYLINSGSNGIIVEKGSPISLAKAIETLILNKDSIEKIGRNARKYIFEHHNPVDYINKLNRIYNYSLEIKLEGKI